MSDPVVGSLELHELRALSDASMPHRARILPATTVKQPGGVVVTTYADPASVAAIPCRVGRASSDIIETMRADKNTSAPLATVSLPVGTIVPSTARIQCDGATIDDAPWSVLFDVVGVVPRHSYEIVLKVLCVPVPAGA
jgi:hypothetical protein